MRWPTQEKPRNLHYIPVFYQEEFAEKRGLIQVYRPGQPIRERSIRETGSAPDFYGFTDGRGHWDNTTVESIFSNEIETPASKVFEKIKTQSTLDSVQRDVLLRFVVSLQRRTPKHKELMMPELQSLVSQRREQLEATVKTDLLAWLISRGESPLRLDALFNAKRGDIERLRVEMLDTKAMVDKLYPEVSAKKSAALPPILRRMDWMFMCAPPGSNFVTSDDPVVHGGLVPPKGIMLLPLTKTVMLQVSWRTQSRWGYVELTSSQVDELNQQTIAHGWYEVYSGQRCEKIKSVVVATLGTGHRLGPGKWPPPWVMEDLLAVEKKRPKRQERLRRKALIALQGNATSLPVRPLSVE